ERRSNPSFDNNPVRGTRSARSIRLRRFSGVWRFHLLADLIQGFTKHFGRARLAKAHVMLPNATVLIDNESLRNDAATVHQFLQQLTKIILIPNYLKIYLLLMHELADTLEVRIILVPNKSDDFDSVGFVMVLKADQVGQ